MVSTAQVRDEFGEPVTGRTASGNPICDFSMGVEVEFPTSLRPSGEIPFLVHPAQVEAWRAFAAAMRSFGYLIDEPSSGTANCRNIDSKPFGDTSLHAHLSAIDLNPSRNTGTDTDQPAELRSALSEIRTRRGDSVFRNLKGDRMHWQIDCSRASLATGIQGAAPVAATPVVEDRSETMMDKETWKRVQRALQALEPPLYEGKDVDGLPGPDTNTAVRAFEKRMLLTQRGVMGPLRDPMSGMWPATRELLFVSAIIGQ
jgi:hypothetical protein